MFPFGRDSTGAKSVIQYLHDNHNYQTRITDGGTYQENVFSTRNHVYNLFFLKYHFFRSCSLQAIRSNEFL